MAISEPALALIEARPLKGGVELLYQIGDRRVAVLLWRGGSTQHPHLRSELGESLGPNLDALLRRTALRDRALIEAAELWRLAGQPARRR
jgi:hypothetical protein